jgi:hypothetical protein
LVGDTKGESTLSKYINMGTVIALGAAIGVVLGALLGNLMFGLMGGAALGVVLGAVVQVQKKKVGK